MSTGWSLYVEFGGNTVEHAILPETKVGRSPQCQVQIRHPHISRHHFTIRFDGGSATLEHAHEQDENPQGSWVTIHSYVNGERVMASAPVSLGDTITVKPKLGDNAIVMKVGASQNPISPKPAKPWWKFW